MESLPVEKRLTAHDNRLNNHGERITQLEKFDEEKHRRLKEVEENYEKLEKTIVNENKEIRLLFQSTMDKQWDLIKSRDEQKHDRKRMRHDLEMTKFERWTDIIFKLVGTGGLLYLIAQAFIN